MQDHKKFLPRFLQKALVLRSQANEGAVGNRCVSAGIPAGCTAVWAVTRLCLEDTG